MDEAAAVAVTADGSSGVCVCENVAKRHGCDRGQQQQKLTL